MEQRLLYAKELYKDETLLKAALCLVICCPENFFKNYNEVFDINSFMSDYHGIDIIEHPELYETEIKPKILKMFELNKNDSKYLDKDDLISSLRKFLFENKNHKQKVKWYILERSYRAYKVCKDIDVRDGRCEYDFRENRIVKAAFNKLQFY